MKSGFDFIKDEDFLYRMEHDLAEFRKTHYRDGSFTGAHGHRLHYTCVRHPKQRAAVVISHGFCEFIRKYDEAIYYLYLQGYTVYFLDQIGHGGSFRYTKEPDRVHIEQFEEYVFSLKRFLDMVVRPGNPTAPLFLLAHSMGGAVGAWFLEAYSDYFKAAVLSSPMLGMNTGRIPAPLVRLLADAAVLTGKKMEYLPTNHGFDHINVFPTSSMLSRPRYDYVFHWREAEPSFRMYGATYGWTRQALRATRMIRRHLRRIKTPVLLCQAGRDHMVLPRPGRLFARKTPSTILLTFPEARHEIFNSTEPDRIRYYKSIFSFFNFYL